ncbi:MAG: hypothetical protein PHH54_05935 [Candidatus Nanoarchaeia archaeon]|nr:hypothetical protein [Candidatus Nanoarchaeia archaeon]MDD5741494.1 hypothetical protein [Candidatus Nanoarchaeia archaeon]
MVTNPSLTEAINSLKTKEGRAGAVFQLLTKQSDANAIEIDGLAGDALRIGVGFAFQQLEFEKGFAMAQKGKILESIITEIIAVPHEFKITGYSEEKNMGIPGSIISLPGFKYDFSQGDYGGVKREEVINWVKSLKRALIKKVLIPKERYNEAVMQMDKLGDMDGEMVDIAIEHLPYFKMAKIVSKTGKGFQRAIEKAENDNRPCLARWLKQQHINSLLNGKSEEHGFSRREKRYVENAIFYADTYFGKEEADRTLESGLEMVIDDFKKEIWKWNFDTQSAEQADHNVYNNRRLETMERKTALQRARMGYLERPHSYADLAINLISQLPEGKKDEFKKRLYHTCDDSFFDYFGIAAALKDRDKILELGIKGLWITSDYPYAEGREAVKGILKGELQNPEEKLKYLCALKKDEAIEEAKGLNVGDMLLDAWMKNSTGKEDEVAIARLASTLGKNDIARNFYIRTRDFTKAVENAENPLDKASLLIQSLEDKIDWRIKFSGHSLAPIEYFERNRFNQEISIMETAIGLARGQKGNKTEYYNNVLRLTKFLFEKKEFQEGALLLRSAMVPRESYLPMMSNGLLESIEGTGDFGGCYWISRMRGKKEQAEKYKVLAVAMKQKVYSKLKSFVYNLPKSPF